MSTLNLKSKSIHLTHEGSPVRHIRSNEKQLRRTVMSCLLWEREFYENGESIANRIARLVPTVSGKVAQQIAEEARNVMHLRHIPLLIASEMSKQKEHKSHVCSTLYNIIQRPDELTEFLAIYWRDGKHPIAKQVKKGLAAAFTKFNAYQLAKYNRTDKAITLRDVLFLVHAKPNKDQVNLWKRLVENKLDPPDTWEVALSKGTDKKESWTRLLNERKLGGLALLRNLRNMQRANVNDSIIKESLTANDFRNVLPFRFVAAAQHAPSLEPSLEAGMMNSFKNTHTGVLSGRTILLVDVSGSMDDSLSSKSQITRIDVACGLAILLREICEDVQVYSFSEEFINVAPRRFFALRDAIKSSQIHWGTYLGKAIKLANQIKDTDRIIVITDEQSHDTVPNHNCKIGYMINVASYQNGVGYGQKWHHIDGWSDGIVSYIQASEQF